MRNSNTSLTFKFWLLCNLPNQDSTRWMNSFDFLKKQTCFVGLKEIDLFSTTRWHDTCFFFFFPDTEKESLLSLKCTQAHTSFLADLCHFYCYEIWLGASVYRILTYKIKLISFHYMVFASCIRICLSTLHGKRTQVWFQFLLMLCFITTEFLV